MAFLYVIIWSEIRLNRQISQLMGKTAHQMSSIVGLADLEDGRVAIEAWHLH